MEKYLTPFYLFKFRVLSLTPVWASSALISNHRLNVIKGVLANITNAEKINKPMNSEEKIRKHMLKLAESQRSTAQQFEAANRNDLRDKELAQVAILEAYAAEVKVVPQGQLKDTILKAIEIKKSEGQACNIGTILQVLRRKDGPLQGETFDNAQAIGILKDLDVAGPGVKYVPS